MRSIALCLALTAAPAAAQDIVFDIFHTEDCLTRGVELTERLYCIGSSAAQCMDATMAGGSTMGMTNCLNRELEWWDMRLNAVYQDARRAERAKDAELADVPGYENQAEALREMQRAWIPFRDAKCAYERSQWTGGTGRFPATVRCMMQETAEQALYLEVMAATY